MKRPFVVAAFLLVFAIGAFLRLQGLDTKFYWRDEVSTSFVVTGHSYAAIGAHLTAIEGRQVTTNEVFNALEQNPDTSPIRLIKDLAENDPQHLPLYFLAAQQWIKIFGASGPAMRALAAALGILSLPLFAWLCLELFGSLRIAWIGLTLVSLSPLHIIYSQQNREYSLWFAATVFSLATLFWANRRPSVKTWAVYSFSVVIGSLSFLFFLPFLCCHCIGQWTTNRRHLKPFAMALALGVTPSLPWLLNIARRTSEVEALNDWSNAPLAFKTYLEGLSVVVARLFFDMNTSSFTGYEDQAGWTVVAILAAGVFACASVASALRQAIGQRAFLASLVFLPFLALIAIDLGGGGGRHALVSRHLVVAWIGIFLAVAHFIGRGVRNRGLATAVFALVIAAEIVSINTCKPAREWWAYSARDLSGAADLIRAQPNRLLIVAHPFSSKQLVSLVYELGPSHPMIVVTPSSPQPPGASFALMTRNEELLAQLRQTFELTKISNEMFIGEKR